MVHIGGFLIENTGNLNRPAASFPDPKDEFARENIEATSQNSNLRQEITDLEKLRKLDLLTSVGRNKATLTLFNPYHFKAFLSEYKRAGARVKKNGDSKALISTSGGNILKVILSSKHIDLKTSISLLSSIISEGNGDLEEISSFKILFNKIGKTAHSLKTKDTKTKLNFVSAEEILDLHSPKAASTKLTNSKTKTQEAKKKKKTNRKKQKPTKKELREAARLRKGKIKNTTILATVKEDEDLKVKVVSPRQKDKQDRQENKWKTQATINITSFSVIKHLETFLSQNDNHFDPNTGFFSRDSDGKTYLIDNQRRIKIEITRNASTQSTLEELRQIPKFLEKIFKELKTSGRAYLRSAGRDKGIDKQIDKERNAMLQLLKSDDLFDSQETILLENHPDGLLPFDSAESLTNSYLKNLRKRQFSKILKGISSEIRAKIPSYVKSDLRKLLIKFINNRIKLESLTSRLEGLTRYELSPRNASLIKDKLKRFKIKVVKLSEWIEIYKLPAEIKEEIQSGINSEEFKTVSSLTKSSRYVNSIKKKLPRFSMMIAGYMAEARVESVIVEKFIKTGLIKSMDASLPFSPSDNHKLDLAIILHDGSEVFLQIKNNEDDLKYFDDSYQVMRDKYKGKHSSKKMRSFPNGLPRCATLSVANKSRTELEHEILNILNETDDSRTKDNSVNSFKYREWTGAMGPQELYKSWPPEYDERDFDYPNKLRPIKKAFA